MPLPTSSGIRVDVFVWRWHQLIKGLSSCSLQPSFYLKILPEDLHRSSAIIHEDQLFLQFQPNPEPLCPIVDGIRLEYLSASPSTRNNDKASESNGVCPRQDADPWGLLLQTCMNFQPFPAFQNSIFVPSEMKSINRSLKDTLVLSGCLDTRHSAMRKTQTPNTHSEDN